MKAIFITGVIAAISLFEIQYIPSAAFSPIQTSPRPGCVIKGNISISTGRKLYHLPGMQDYEITIIDTSKGERWFCTEAEAKANGWTKAPR